jgi:hypothetical protein
MHAAYRRGTATSAAPSLRDSVPATPPQLLRSDPHPLQSNCLPAPPPLGSLRANPGLRLQPRAQPPQPTPRIIIHALPAFASTRSHHKPSRCTHCTTEVQRRQLRHPSETRCQRRCPIISEAIACTHRRPSARPSRNPHHQLQPRVQPPQPTPRIIIHAQPAFASTRSQRSWPMQAGYH